MSAATITEASSPADVQSMDDYDAFVDSLTPPSAQEVDAILEDSPAPGDIVQPPAEPAQTEEAPPEAAAETPPAQQEPEPAATLANNFRLDAGHDPVTQLTFQILKEHAARGEHIRPSVAEAIARERLAPPPAEAPPAEATPGTGDATTDPAVAALLQQDAALADKLKAAVADFDEAAQAEILNQRAVLGREIVKAELRAERAMERAQEQAAAQEASLEAALAASRAAVQATYGATAAQGTPMARLMLGITTEWEATGDPRFNDPRLPELAAEEAAAQLGVKPASGSAATAPPAAKPISASQAAPRSTPPVAPPIAPGSARSSDPGTSSLPQFSSMAEYDSYLEKEFGRSQL